MRRICLLQILLFALSGPTLTSADTGATDIADTSAVQADISSAAEAESPALVGTMLLGVAGLLWMRRRSRLL